MIHWTPSDELKKFEVKTVDILSLLTDKTFDMSLFLFSSLIHAFPGSGRGPYIIAYYLFFVRITKSLGNWWWLIDTTRSVTRISSELN